MSPIMTAASTASTSTNKTTTKTTTTTANMAVSRGTKSKVIKPTKANSDASASSKAKAQQLHRRSRTGCFTCRLRRKKCDEGTPTCTACKHLGIKCEYKRPSWWINPQLRSNQKDDIKMIIKRKKLSEKASAAHTTIHTAVSSPPGLSHSLPTSATFSDPLDRTRSTSVDSQLSFDFNSPPTSSEYGPGSSAFTTPLLNPDCLFYNTYQPYDVAIKTERQMYVDDVPTLRESSSSTFSTFQSPPPPGSTVLPPYAYGTPCMDPAAATAASTAGATMDPSAAAMAYGAGTPVVVGLGMIPGMPVCNGSAAATTSEWIEQVYSERRESTMEETLNMPLYDYTYGDAAATMAMSTPTMTTTAAAAAMMTTPGSWQSLALELDDGDRQLLDHFLVYVLPTLFPVLEATQRKEYRDEMVLQALANNKCYQHCCLSVAAQHLQATLDPQQGLVLNDAIMHHRYATISTLCDALGRDENHVQLLDAALGLIFFQCCVGRFDNVLPDVSWHQHFQAVASLVQKLDLPRLVTEAALEAPLPPPAPSSLPPAASLSEDGQVSAPAVQAPPPAPPVPSPPSAAAAAPSPPAAPFSMTLTAWIDIVGAAMQGRAPTFAHTYREKHLSASSSLGLRELMGCEDRVMYLISEIACLEALRNGGMDQMSLCHHVTVLGEQIGYTETGEPPLEDEACADAEQLSRKITNAFRLAARVYLCSLVPGFHPAFGDKSCIKLVQKLTDVLKTIPTGPQGYDRCVAWPYLIAGAFSLPGSEFRNFFADRIKLMGEAAQLGSFAHVVTLLCELWNQQALQQQKEQKYAQEHHALQQQQSLADGGLLPPPPVSSVPYIHWRDIMRMKGWDFLLI